MREKDIQRFERERERERERFRGLIVKFIALLVILDDLYVLLLIWLGFDLLALEMFGMKFFVFS